MKHCTLDSMRKSNFWVLTIIVSGFSADVMSALIQRINREAETDAMELATIQWLQLLPILVQACAQLSCSSAFLNDIFQVSHMTACLLWNLCGLLYAKPFVVKHTGW